MVIQLGSSAAARIYLTIYNGVGDTVPFRVSGIPGARGFGDQGGINIVFADGDYAYLVGAGWNGSTQTVTKAQLLAAAKLLYHRVHEH